MTDTMKPDNMPGIIIEDPPDIETFFDLSMRAPMREKIETYRDYIEDTKGFRPSFHQAVVGLVHMGAEQVPSLYYRRREPTEET